MAYLLDDDVFIQAKNMHYGFPFCPAFWDWLDRAHSAGIVYSIDRVLTDLQGHTDGLAQWARSRPNIFLPPDTAAMTSFAAVSAWANGHQRYSRAAIAEFLSVTDSYLVAYAHAHGYTVVTQEASAPLSVARVKIPDACNEMTVRSISTFDMLRAEAPQFILA